MATECKRISTGVTLLGDFCPDCHHVVAVHDDKRMCAVCMAVEAMTVKPEEFELVCDLIEILLAFGSWDPRPLTGSPAEGRIFAFRDMRLRRRG